MRDTQKELDIAKNIKMIEWLKTEVVETVAVLFRGFQQGSETLLKGGLANLVVLSYLMARRLGMRYSQFDSQIREQIRQNLEMDDAFFDWREDLSILEEHFQNKK
ncbi:MazG-like family protein [Effusibacillus dendaii]|uniref:MazG-like family protein n=1 Tax=Effusibacillus dendaii TaxID=2743772 RepID=UPI00190920D6|nr:MazG-like family protein [Effusibacillus dendaii]